MDLDGDGFSDILSGSYSRMESSMAGLFQVLKGDGDGNLKPAVPLTGSDDQPLIIPIADQSQQTENICTRPTAVDWDGDGDLDLVVGNFAGTFYLFSGDGRGQFQPQPQPILAGEAPLRITGAHSDPFVVDWDSDGDLDIVSGSSQGGVQWSENQAGPKRVPEMTAFVTLIEPQPHQQYQLISQEELTGPTHDTRVWVDDVNEDGKLDILVGDTVTLISPAEGVTAEEYGQRLAAWQKEFQEASAFLPATISTDAEFKEYQKKLEQYQKVYQKRSEFMSEEMTGFVWLYLQK